MYASDLRARESVLIPASQSVVRLVREGPGSYDAGSHPSGYEVEGSERRSLGSVSVSSQARWDATITVPIPDGQVAFVHLERRGPLPAGYRGSEEVAAFSVPAAEIDAVLVLMSGIVAHARRDNVLSSQIPSPVQ